MSSTVTDTAAAVAAAREQRDAAVRALEAAEVAVQIALRDQEILLNKIDLGLGSVTAAAMQKAAAEFEFRERVVPGAGRALERAEVNLKVATAEHLTATVQGDSRLNGIALVAMRAAAGEHVRAAVQLAADFYESQTAGFDEAEALGAAAEIPTAKVEYYGPKWPPQVTLTDPLAGVHRTPRGLVIDVGLGEEVPGARDGLLVVEGVADCSAAARKFVLELVETEEVTV